MFPWGSTLCESNQKKQGSYRNPLWRYRDITYINIDISPVKSINIYRMAILKEISQPSIIKTTLRITYLKFHPYFPGGGGGGGDFHTDWTPWVARISTDMVHNHCYCRAGLPAYENLPVIVIDAVSSEPSAIMRIMNLTWLKQIVLSCPIMH